MRLAQASSRLSARHQAATAPRATHTVVPDPTCTAPLPLAAQVFNGRAGPASDVFSFGVLTWHVTTGQLPYEDINPFAVMLAVSKGELSLDWPSGVPKPLRRLGRLCTQHDPKLRPTFTQIVSALLKLDAKLRKTVAEATPGGASGKAAAGGSSRGWRKGF